MNLESIVKGLRLRDARYYNDGVAGASEGVDPVLIFDARCAEDDYVHRNRSLSWSIIWLCVKLNTCRVYGLWS